MDVVFLCFGLERRLGSHSDQVVIVSAIAPWARIVADELVRFQQELRLWVKSLVRGTLLDKCWFVLFFRLVRNIILLIELRFDWVGVRARRLI